MKERQQGFTFGRSSYFWAYRNYLLKKILGTDFREIPPKKHQITIFKKEGFRSINNLEDVAKYVQSKFGNEANVSVVSPEKLSVKEQALLFLNTTLLISPCGGIALPGILLPSNDSNSHFFLVHSFLKKNQMALL